MYPQHNTIPQIPETHAHNVITPQKFLNSIQCDLALTTRCD